MLRTYKYRLYPTTDQAQALSEILQAGCWLYNAALHFRRKWWQESRHSITYYEQAAMWRNWRNEEPDENPLRILNMSAGQQVLRRLDRAFRDFFQGKRGYPRFKKSQRFNSLNYKPGDGSRIQDRKLYVQNVDLVTVRWHRTLPDGKLKNIVLLRKPSGWYVCPQVELPEPEQHLGPAVGIDMGITHALALSDETVFDSPKHLQQSLARLRRLQRKVARRKKGSKRRRQAARQLAKQQEHIANQRCDWWHSAKPCYAKVTRKLVDTYGTIVLENLNLNFMLQNGNLARAAHDVSLGMFRELLDYKAIEAGVEMITVDPAFTSQACSSCGCIVPQACPSGDQKSLSVRTHHYSVCLWRCPDCGLTIDRDVNAACNILSAGTRRSGANVDGCIMRSPRSSPLLRGEPSRVETSRRSSITKNAPKAPCISYGDVGREKS
jgi:putative transposase